IHVLIFHKKSRSCWSFLYYWNPLPSTRDLENSSKYYHLVLPSSQGSEQIEGEENQGKHKFQVKELYLTKLLSTKVAIHSSVEKLFRSIWTIPTNKPPTAVKYFFDLLDSQAEIKKITDLDVLHIWKTNSLPLRFWVNILKNPQFVFDLKKTHLLESCLSVIAQAFMDSFSISEQHLGKSSPTNKLLYAKDIPMFKEEVKNYYKGIRDAPPVSSAELNEFLMAESKKHENEFKEDVALLELYKYIKRYHQVVLDMLEKEPGFEDEQKQLLDITALMEDKKKCMWN
uniref:Plexin cytoplasmic RasGAP domain-containing protein n=1 Tax=Xenopus tropicalis TaxID=8364 RepID=A0A6I8QVL7_XENTR